MTTALILGATGGIGSAVSRELALRGYATTELSRQDGFDICDPASVSQTLGELGPFEVVFVATGRLDGAGHPPEKSLRALTAEAMADQFRINALGPALVLQHLQRLLPRKGPSHAAVLSARVGSIGDNRLGGWYSYRAAKAALNQFMHSAAVELARTHKEACLLSLHPGTVATRFTAGFPAHDKISPEESASRLLDVLLSKSQEESGTFWDWKNQQVPW